MHTRSSWKVLLCIPICDSKCKLSTKIISQNYQNASHFTTFTCKYIMFGISTCTLEKIWWKASHKFDCKNSWYWHAKNISQQWKICTLALQHQYWKRLAVNHCIVGSFRGTTFSQIKKFSVIGKFKVILVDWWVHVIEYAHSVAKWLVYFWNLTIKLSNLILPLQITSYNSITLKNTS